MKSIILAGVLALTFQFEGNQLKTEEHLKQKGTVAQAGYDATKRKVAELRKTANSGKDLENYLLNMIIPHWYGTPWDFNGYTAVPQKGEIACGYFVSTTLLHAGFKLNRYKLAQQAGLYEAKTLAITEDNYEVIYGKEKLKRILKERYKDGLYFVGLDNHVGYLYLRSGKAFFIHSNYIEDKVMIEEAMDAEAFQSGVYVIANISTNEQLLDKWRRNQTISVVTP